MRRELEKTQSERDQDLLEWDQAILERDLLSFEVEPTRKVQEATDSRNQLKSELQQLQRGHQEGGEQPRAKGQDAN